MPVGVDGKIMFKAVEVIDFDCEVKLLMRLPIMSMYEIKKEWESSLHKL